MSSIGEDVVNVLCKEAAKLKLEGNGLFKAKKYKAAASKYRVAIEKDPSNAVYYTNLCICLNHLKLFDEMNTLAKKCIDIEENYVKGHYWLIMSLKKQKKFKEAFRQSEKSLEKFPDNLDLKLLHSQNAAKVKRCSHANCPNQTTGFNTKDLLKCSSCKVKYYCSKRCQEKDWPQHKFSCRIIRENCSIESYTEGAQQFDCVSCKKRFLITQMRLCRICNASEGYCSSICEENDKQRHEPKCKILQKQAFSKKSINFIRKWYDNIVASLPIAELATHAMTKKEFLSKNPEFFVLFEWCFNGKYCSFVPTKKPEIIYFSDMLDEEVADLKQLFAQYKDSVGPFEVGHVIFSIFWLNGKEIPIKKHKVFDAESYRHLSLEEAMTSSFNHVNNMYNPILPPLWMELFYERLLEQLKEWILDNQILIAFVLASFRSGQSKTLFRPPDEYILVFTFEHGEQLGEIKQIVSYSVKKIADVKNPHERGHFIQKMRESRYNISEEEYTFFLTFKSRKALPKSINRMDFPLPIPISSRQIPLMEEEEIDKEIKRLWKLLLKIPFPKCPPTPEYPKTFYTC